MPEDGLRDEMAVGFLVTATFGEGGGRAVIVNV